MFNTPQQFAQPGLPFNPTAPQWQSIQININNCPVNVSLLQNKVHPNLLPYLTGIAVSAIDSLQSRAGQNALRMFLFNQLASNNYNNNEFYTLLIVICDIAEFYGASGVQIEQAITSAVDLSIQFAAFNNLQNFPGLGQYVDQNLGNNLNALQQKQNQLTQQVTGYKQQKAARMNGGFTGQVSQPNQFDGFQVQQPAQQASWNNSSTGMFGGVNTPAPAANQMTNSWDNRSNATSGLNDWRKPEVQQAPVNQTPAWVAKPTFSFRDQPTQQVEQPIQQPVQQPAQPEPILYKHGDKVMVKHGDPGVKFKRTERWFMAPSPSLTADVYYILHEDGSMEPVIKKLTKEEIVEKSKHLPASACSQDPAWRNILSHNAHERRMQVLEDFEKYGIRVATSLPSKTTDTPVKDEEVVKDDTHLITTSQDETWSQTDVGMTVSDTVEKPCEAYSKPALLVTPLVSKTGVEELVENINGSVSLEQCASKMKVEQYAIQSLTDKKQNRDRQVIYGRVNKMLTKSVNKFLRFKLGLPELSIDAFDADAGDLATYLESNYPNQYVASLKKHQKRIISNVISNTTDGLLGSEFDECVREQQLPSADLHENQTVFLYSKEIYMSVNHFSGEFSLALENEKDAVGVYPDSNVLIYSLCKQLIGDSPDDDIYGYYIKTLDDTVYEVHPSALMPGVFIIGLRS